MNLIDKLGLLTNLNSTIQVSYQWQLVATDVHFLFMDSTGRSIKIEDDTSKQIIEFIYPKTVRLSTLLNHFNKRNNEISFFQIKLLELTDCGLCILRNGNENHTISKADLERFKCQLKHFETKELLGLSNYQIQQNLFNSNVAIIGLGALGSHIAMLLAASGIRSFTLIDGDKISISNLPRQFHYKEKEIDKFKTKSIKNKLLSFDRNIKITIVNKFLDTEKIVARYIQNKDFVILCGDMPSGKISTWIGETCFQNNLPYISMAGSWVGPLCIPSISPCYVCQTIFNSKQITDLEKYFNLLERNSNEIIPSFPTGPSLTASLISTAVIEYLGGYDKFRLANKRIHVDYHGNFKEIEMKKYENCWRCGNKNNII